MMATFGQKKKKKRGEEERREKNGKTNGNGRRIIGWKPSLFQKPIT